MKLFYAVIAALFLAIASSCSGRNSASSAQTDSITESEAAETSRPVSDTAKAADAANLNAGQEEDVVMTKMVSNGKPSVVDFSATWCGPCKIMKPIFHKLAAEFADKYNFITIDVDEEPALAQKYHIQAVPTFIFIDTDGEEGDRITGAVKEAELRDMLQNSAWF